VIFAERLGETYRIRGLPRPGDPDYACGWASMLSFRQVQGLVAVREGLAVARERRRYTPYFVDVHLVAECDVYGVGDFTMWDLQRWHLVAYNLALGPLTLTLLGREVLDAICTLPGIRPLALAA
jgi:hypothetical protein